MNKPHVLHTFLKNATASANYFSHEDHYYLSEAGGKAPSEWFGEGAKRLGLLDQAINRNTLENILSGQLPNGKTVGLLKNGVLKHRPGIQLVFSAPKSVSLLAFASQNTVLAQKCKKAHDDAVRYTLTRIERDCSQSRTKVAGQFQYENTKNMVAALMQHALSRENDPQLHTHALLMNITQRSDQAWRAQASSVGGKPSDEIQGFNNSDARLALFAFLDNQ